MNVLDMRLSLLQSIRRSTSGRTRLEGAGLTAMYSVNETSPLVPPIATYSTIQSHVVHFHQQIRLHSGTFSHAAGQVCEW